MTNGKINRSVKLEGMGNALGGSQLVFGGEKRYRLRPGESLLDLACLAAERALEEAGEEIGGMDCIVCAMATPLQAIPCNAALVHERIPFSVSMETRTLPLLAQLVAPRLPRGFSL